MFTYPIFDVEIVREVDPVSLGWPEPGDAQDETGLGCNRSYRHPKTAGNTSLPLPPLRLDPKKPVRNRRPSLQTSLFHPSRPSSRQIRGQLPEQVWERVVIPTERVDTPTIRSFRNRGLVGRAALLPEIQSAPVFI